MGCDIAAPSGYWRRRMTGSAAPRIRESGITVPPLRQRLGLTSPQYRPSMAKSWSGNTSIGA